jgi:acyl carrier protein
MKVKIRISSQDAKEMDRSMLGMMLTEIGVDGDGTSYIVLDDNKPSPPKCLIKNLKACPVYTESSIKQAFVKRVAQCLGVRVEKVTPEARFIENFGADSLDIIELVMATEDEFDIEISDEDVERIHTVGEALEYLKTRL